MPRTKRACSTPGCPSLTDTGGRCPECRRHAERIRGSARHRGYDAQHERLFRRAVLRRDRMCVICLTQPSAHADHHPLSRRELVERGLDPNDPQRGRGLCPGCHSRETARHQPGGWHATQGGG